MKLSGEQKEQIQLAILDGYPSKDALQMMVGIKMNESLDVIVSGDNLASAVFNLVEWSISTGRTLSF